MLQVCNDNYHDYNDLPAVLNDNYHNDNDLAAVPNDNYHDDNGDLPGAHLADLRHSRHGPLGGSCQAWKRLPQVQLF